MIDLLLLRRVRDHAILGPLAFCLIVLFLAGCSAKRYQAAADREAYGIIQQKQQSALGKTNEFSIDTRYSNRKADAIKPGEIIEDRLEQVSRVLTLPEALDAAFRNSRQYQLRKETLYISALSLTRERFSFAPHFFGGTTVAGERSSNGERSGSVGTRAGMDAALKTGGRIGLDVANDLLRFYTGDPRKSAFSTISLSLAQPLLRGAGAKIAAENLTQAERDVIYEIRSFSYYQHTFSFDIVSTYFRLLQQQDTVRNQYANYQSRISLRQRTVALAFDRLAPFQADQATQEELAARNSYILAIERYRSSLDAFKLTLGLPLGHDIKLDETALKDLEAVGLLPVPLLESEAYQLALDRRLDLLNEIDRFEDSKRKIPVAASGLKTELTLFGDVSLGSERPTDYAKFNLNDYRASGGLQLNLPLNRKLERNAYRSSILNFERQLRTFALFLDELKGDVRADLRTLDQARQSFEIQSNAKALADRRVESSELSLQAGRVQVRDVVDAQTARVQAYNAATAALVDYHLTRLRLLLDIGVLKSDLPKFWLQAGDLPKPQDGSVVPKLPTAADTLITPEQLFEK
ncbi:MAG: TolC family protein [Verrucomicrobiales bacterium]|nr:TolC family protein [Verrucomicrobiales bacterium]